MVQIFQAPQQRRTQRQTALQGGLDQLVQGIGGIGAGMARQEATQRQQALQERQQGVQNLQLAQQLTKSSGESVSPDDVQSIISGEAPSQVPLEGMEGPPQSLVGKILGGVASRTQEEREFKKAERRDKKARRDLDKEVKEGQLTEQRRKAREANKPFEETREAEVLRFKQAQAVAKSKGVKKPSSAQFKAAGFATRASEANKALEKLSADVGTGFFQGVVGNSYFPEALKTEEQKQFEQLKGNFISAVLRPESGAAISDDEYDREDAKYFPASGDTDVVLAQKARARQQVVNNLSAEAGGALGLIAVAPIEGAEGLVAGQQSPQGQGIDIGQGIIDSVAPAAQAAPQAQVPFLQQVDPAKATRLQELRQKAGR